MSDLKSRWISDLPSIPSWVEPVAPPKKWCRFIDREVLLLLSKLSKCYSNIRAYTSSLEITSFMKGRLMAADDHCLKPNVSFLSYDFEDSIGILKAHYLNHITSYHIISYHNILYDMNIFISESESYHNHIQNSSCLLTCSSKSIPSRQNPQSPSQPEANVPLQTKVWVPELPWYPTCNMVPTPKEKNQAIWNPECWLLHTLWILSFCAGKAPVFVSKHVKSCYLFLKYY